MAQKRTGIINVSKGLMNVSFAALTAIGSATGNPLIAGATAIPQALASSGILKPLLEKKAEEHLALPIPPWWTGEPQIQSWQTVCSHIESHFPETVKGVEDHLREATGYLSSTEIKQTFAEQVAQQLPSWEVRPQDRELVAGYLTPLLLEKSATVLKTAIDSSREDALAKWMVNIADTLDAIQKSTTPTTSTHTAATVIQANTPTLPTADTTQSSQSIAALLEQKRQNNAYDVYICYDEADETEVMDIGQKLKVQGILPWLDMLEVRPGTPEQRQQEQQIQKIPAASVFVGQHKIVDKQELQMYSFINQFFEREIPVIPVILASAPKDFKLPPYLGTFGKVDFRRSMPEPLGQLLYGITGKRPSI